MKEILFVCLGNICRSPMAEGLFSAELKKQGLEGEIKVDSAATSRWEVGSPPHPGTKKVLQQQKISTAGMRARLITPENFAKADWIIGMDADNVSDLQQIAPPGTEDKIHLYLEGTNLADKTIPDPYYTGDFQETYRLIKVGLDYWLKEVQGTSQ